MSIEETFAHLLPFNSERLPVRPMKVSDAETMFAIKSDPMVTEAYGAEPHRSIGETREWIEGILDASGQRGALFWVFVPKGEGGPSGAAATGTSTGGPGAPNWDTSYTCLTGEEE